MAVTTPATPKADEQHRSIPRVLHWIWLGPNPLPPQHREFLHTWERHHPEWERRIWTEDDLPALRNDEAYRSARTWAQKADVARYEILLRHGGVYLDTDMECVGPLEPAIIGVDAFVGLERSDLMGNAVLGCVPGHPWMAAVVDALPEAVRGNWLTLDQTGPAFLTRVTAGRTDVTVFPPEVFYPHPSVGAKPDADLPEGAIAVHHWRRSWAESEVALVRTAVEACVERTLPPGTTCVCVDGGLPVTWSSGRTAVPFVERDGVDQGPPADDEQALAELRRQRSRGIHWFVFLVTADWWLQYYTKLGSVLRDEAVEIVEDRSLVAFHMPPL